MRQIDMSREAVTARLKLVSQLSQLCLSLGTAKIRTQSPARVASARDSKRTPNEAEDRRK